MQQKHGAYGMVGCPCNQPWFWRACVRPPPMYGSYAAAVYTLLYNLKGSIVVQVYVTTVLCINDFQSGIDYSNC